MKVYFNGFRKVLVIAFIFSTIMAQLFAEQHSGDNRYSSFTPDSSGSVVFYLDSVCGNIGDTVSVNMKVIGVKDMEYLLGAVRFNPFKVKFIELIEIPEFRVSYLDETSFIYFFKNTEPISFDDDETIFTMRFIIIGEIGDEIDIIPENFNIVNTEGDIYPTMINGLICVNTPDKLLVTSKYCSTLSDSADASMSFKVFGGSPPYSYSIFKNGDSTILQAGGDLVENYKISVFGLFSNEVYSIKVVDAMLDTFVEEVNIDTAYGIRFDDIVIDSDCNNKKAGKIRLVTNKRDSQLYDVKWSNLIYNTDSIDQLAKGDYAVTVIEKNSGCQIDTSVHLKLTNVWIDSTWTKDATCKEICDGIAFVKADHDGMGVLSYKWSNGADSDYLDSLCQGNYGVTITNEDKCAVERSFYINTSSDITVSVDSILDIYSSTIPGAIYISFDTTDKIFSWSGPNDYFSSNQSVTNLNWGGCYTITINDTITHCTVDSTFCITDRTGVKNIGINKMIEIYPNPAKEFLTIDFLEYGLVEAIRILDISGLEIMNIQKPSDVKSIRLDVSKLGNGFFIVAVKFKGARMIYKKVVLY